MSTRPFLGTERADLSARKPYDIIDEPVGRDYWGLIDGAIPHCNSGVLRARRDLLDEPGARVLDSLTPFVVSEVSAGQMGNIVRFTLNMESAAILKSVANRLYEWQEPHLPADLCLFRTDGSPWLVTVASEGLGYVELTSFEKLLLARGAPGLPQALAHRAARDAILAVFERRYEGALEPLVHEVVAHAGAFVDEGRDGLVDALGEWLQSGDATRVSVALSVISQLQLDEFVDELEELRHDTYAGRIQVPAVFDRNAVLRDRWLALRKEQLDQTLGALKAQA